MRGEGIDPATASAAAKRGMYGTAGHTLTNTLNILTSIPCHLVVTAHPEQYEMRRNPKGKVKNIKETDVEIIGHRMIPSSSSRPHGATMAKFFQDVLWLTIGVDNKRYIDATISPDRDGGGTWNDKQYASQYSLANLIKEIGGKEPDQSFTGFTEYQPGEFEFTARTPSNQTLQAPPKSSVMSLLGKKG